MVEPLPPLPTAGQDPWFSTRNDFDVAVRDRLEAGVTARRVHVIGLWGQSNMSGRGAPFSAFLDPANDRIKQFGSGATTITPATEPLDMHDVPTGIGPGLQFARQYLRTLPEDDIILLTPSAEGGTMLVSNAVLAWRWGVAGNLTAQAIAQINAAMAEAAETWPSAEIVLDGILWFQGETDSSAANMVTGAAYQADLDLLISGVRSTFDMPDLPFVIAQFIPEAMAVGTRVQVDLVQSETPFRVAHTGFALAPPAGYSNGDALHANAAAHRLFYGPRMFEEFTRIRAGIAPVNPVSPPPPGTVIFSDNFNRADGPLGSTPIGDLPWIVAPGSVTVVANGLAMGAGTSVALVDAEMSDGLYRTVVRTAATGLLQIVFRGVDATANHLSLTRTDLANQFWTLWKRVSGNPTVIASSGIPIADGDVVEVNLNGEAVTVTVNGAEMFDGMVPEFATATRYGYRSTATGAVVEEVSLTAI